MFVCCCGTGTGGVANLFVFQQKLHHVKVTLGKCTVQRTDVLTIVLDEIHIVGKVTHTCKHIHTSASDW